MHSNYPLKDLLSYSAHAYSKCYFIKFQYKEKKECLQNVQSEEIHL